MKNLKAYINESIQLNESAKKCQDTIKDMYDNDGDLVSVASCFLWLDELGWDEKDPEEWAEEVHDINDDVDPDYFIGWYYDGMVAMVELGRKKTLDFIKKISSKEEMDDYNIKD